MKKSDEWRSNPFSGMLRHRREQLTWSCWNVLHHLPWLAAWKVVKKLVVLLNIPWTIIEETCPELVVYPTGIASECLSVGESLAYECFRIWQTKSNSTMTMHFFHWPRQMPEARVILDTCSRQHPCFHDTLARLSIQTLAEVEWFVAYVRILTSPSASNLPPNNSYEEKNCCEK